MTRRRMTGLLVLVVGVVAVGCIDVTVDSKALGSIEFPPLPYPSIDGGDTLRDTLGKAVPLVARVYRANGALDPTLPVTFIAFDTLVTTPSAGNYIVARALNFAAAASYNARLVATSGSLQSLSRSITIVARPDDVTTATPAQDTILYSAPAAASDTSMALSIRLTGKAGSTPVAVPAYIVRYTLRNLAGQPVTATDTTLAFFLVDDQGRVSATDTTDGAGTASRRLRFRIRQGQRAIDTMRVLAKVSRGTRIVPGDTTSWLVVVRPK